MYCFKIDWPSFFHYTLYNPPPPPPLTREYHFLCDPVSRTFFSNYFTCIADSLPMLDVVSTSHQAYYSIPLYNDNHAQVIQPQTCHWTVPTHPTLQTLIRRESKSRSNNKQSLASDFEQVTERNSAICFSNQRNI